MAWRAVSCRPGLYPWRPGQQSPFNLCSPVTRPESMGGDLRSVCDALNCSVSPQLLLNISSRIFAGHMDGLTKTGERERDGGGERRAEVKQKTEAERDRHEQFQQQRKYKEG